MPATWRVVAEVESIFDKPIALVPDPAHSRNEEHLKAIGRTAEGRHVFVVFTLRSRERCDADSAPISACYMHRKKVEYYEETASRTQNR